MKITKTKIVKQIEIDFRNIKIGELAKYCGVKRQTVWNWRKKKSFPTPKHIICIKEFLAMKQAEKSGHKG